MDISKVNGQTINILDGEQEIFPELARRIAELAEQCIAEDGLFTMALSGGNTPRGLYSYMAGEYAETFPWKKTYLFLGDERCVSHSDGDSNYKMVSDSLLSHISIPSTNVFPTINQDKDPQDSAKRYEAAIKRFFKDSDQEGNHKPLPRFSLCLMGLGPDGHTASLFPGTAVLEEKEKLCVANYVEKLDSHRLTLTRPVFGNARKLFFLVAGAAKADIFAQVVGSKDMLYPSQMVIGDCRPDSVEWFVDRACAAKLSSLKLN